jgi:hypothetical protein
MVFRNRDEHGNIAPTGAWFTLNEVGSLPLAPEETEAYKARAEAIEEYKMNTSSNSNSVESPDISQASFGGIASGMGLDTGQDQGWTWGMWENEIFDSLAMGTAFDMDRSVAVGGDQTSSGMNFG